MWVSPYNDPMIIAGQGTVGLEILQRQPDIDTVLVPETDIAAAIRGKKVAVVICGANIASRVLAQILSGGSSNHM